MHKKIVSLIGCLFFLVVAPSSAAAVEKGSILIVNSINSNELWTKLFSEEMTIRLEKEGFRVEYVELNVPAITKIEECDEKCKYLLAIFPKKPQLVVYIGDPAWLVTRKLFDDEWSEVPSFICHAQSQVPETLDDLISRNISPQTLVSADDIRKDYSVTTVEKPILLKETITLMKELLPKMEKLVFLSDDRYISLMVKANIEQILKQYFPELKFESLTSQDLSVQQLLDRISGYDTTAGILYYSWFRVRTSNASNFLEDNIHKVIYGFSKVPIFNLNDMSNNDDYFAGGCYVPLSEFVGNVIFAINDLVSKPFQKGVSKVTNVGKSGRFLNYHHLLYHGIDPALYPKDAVYYQAPMGFYEKYQVHIIAGILLALFAIVLIIIMIRSSIHKVNQRNQKIQLLNEYRKLVDNMPMVYMQKEELAGGNYLFKDVNTAFESLFDCDRTSIIGKELHSLIPENSKLSALAYDTNFNNILVTDKLGKQRYFDRIILDDSETNYVEEFWVDSTEEYKISLEKENNRLKLNELHDKYELVLNAANFGIWEYDLVARVLFCNLTYFFPASIDIGQREYHISFEDFLTHVYQDDKSSLIAKIEELTNGTQYAFNYEYRTDHFLNDKERWIECNAIVNKRDSNGKAVSIVGAAVDITERKNMEDDLVNAKIRAEESNLLKSAFLANMSHEIRTPLNAIVGFSNVLARTDDESERLEYLSIIETNNELLLRLISDILDLSKIDAGLLEFEYDDVNVTGLFCDLEQEMNYNIKNGVTFYFDNHDNECILYTERNRLLQVVKNLLTNAKKFTNEGEIHLGYREIENNKVYFYVTDSGCGIDNEQLSGVFERFVKLNSFVQGTGLGLSICKTIIARLGGEIGVDSEVGKGSTFWFTLPNIQSEQCTEEVEEGEQKATIEDNSSEQLSEKEQIGVAKKMILIAEDVESNYKLFQSILRNDYNLIHAWDGVEAVKLFKELQPDLILMDIKMPNMDGYEATAEIRKTSNVTIFATTAFAFAEDEKTVMSSGFDAYITKPIDARQLKAIIKTHLGT